MTQSTNRPLATVFAALVAAALWLPTLAAPTPAGAYATAVDIELA